MNTITVKKENLYKILIGIVHPDRNPNDPTATQKAQDVNFNKSNPSVLMALAKMWHIPIIIDGENTNNGSYVNPNNSTSRSTFNENIFNRSTSTFKPVVCDIVNIRGLGSCYILGIETITTGKYSGGTKYHIWSTLKHSFYNYRTNTGVIAGVVSSLGKISTSQLNDYKEQFLNIYGRRVDKNVSTLDIRKQFEKVGLKQNTFYGGTKKVKVVGYGEVFDVQKTTEKCVYILYYGKSTRKSIDKIRTV